MMLVLKDGYQRRYNLLMTDFKILCYYILIIYNLIQLKIEAGVNIEFNSSVGITLIFDTIFIKMGTHNQQLHDMAQ